MAVHVLVRQNGRAITDLKPGELVLTDSGVRQELTAIAAGAVPIDVSLAVEHTEASTFLRRAYASEMAEVLPLLADGDRLRLVSIGEEVREIVPLSAKGPRIEAPRPIKSTWAALYDALAFLFVRPGEPGRQHVVILMSRGLDDASVVSADALMELAKRSDAHLHVLVTERTTRGSRTVRRVPAAASSSMDWEEGRTARLRAWGALKTTAAQFQAEWEDSRERLVRIAEATGGGEIRRGLFSDSIADPVRHVLEEVRSGYVLYYVPAGVPDTGWHPIEVTVARPGKFEVRARPGYIK